LQLFSVNEEFLVSTISSECADYVPVLCTHRPSLLPIECFSEIFGLVFRAASRLFGIYRKDAQTGSFRGSKSRNKVFVGEPAYGSLPFLIEFRIRSNTKHKHRTIVESIRIDRSCRTITHNKIQDSFSILVVLFQFSIFITNNKIHCCLSLIMNRVYQTYRFIVLFHYIK
jgi:hypothetical protein